MAAIVLGVEGVTEDLTSRPLRVRVAPIVSAKIVEPISWNGNLIICIPQRFRLKSFSRRSLQKQYSYNHLLRPLFLGKIQGGLTWAC